MWFGVEMAFRSSCAQVFISFFSGSRTHPISPSVGCVAAKTVTLANGEPDGSAVPPTGSLRNRRYATPRASAMAG